MAQAGNDADNLAVSVTWAGEAGAVPEAVTDRLLDRVQVQTESGQ